jgi:hypothetical protein
LIVNCRRVRSQLSAYVDNELTGYEMFVLRDHLSHCRECRDEHYSLKTMKYLLSALPEKEPNPEWVAFLAESFSRPAPSFAQRLLIYWERSLSAAASLFVTNGGQERVLAQNRRLLSAFALSAVGIFLITASFDRPPTRVASDPSATQSTATASISPFGPWYSSNRPAAHPPGEYIFVPMPISPSTLSGGASSFLPPNSLVRPEASTERDSYLKSIDMHVIPAPGGMNGFGTSFTGPRFATPSIGH